MYHVHVEKCYKSSDSRAAEDNSLVSNLDIKFTFHCIDQYALEISFICSPVEAEGRGAKMIISLDMEQFLFVSLISEQRDRSHYTLLM